MKMRTILMTTLLTVGMAFASDSPHLIPFQGRLTDQQGSTYTNGEYTIIFNMYDLAVSGTPSWTERHYKVGVIDGIINVFLGSITPFESRPDLDFSETVYLGITIDADHIPSSPDPEMVPRQLIIPAFQAKNSELLDGHDFSAILESGDDPTASKISASRLQLDGITTNQIGTGAVASDEIADGSIVSTDIQNGTITEADLTAALQFRLSEGLLPAGMVAPFAGSTNNIPDGWLLCDGDAISSTNYPDLFAAIGTAWGNGVGDEDGSTDFRLPDMRGLFLRGVTHSSTNDVDVASRTNQLYAGAAVGNTVGSYQQDDFEEHTHRHNVGANTANRLVNIGQHSFWERSNAKDTEPKGGNETRPKNVYVNYIIKY